MSRVSSACAEALAAFAEANSWTGCPLFFVERNGVLRLVRGPRYREVGLCCSYSIEEWMFDGQCFRTALADLSKPHVLAVREAACRQQAAIFCRYGGVRCSRAAHLAKIASIWPPARRQDFPGRAGFFVSPRQVQPGPCSGLREWTRQPRPLPSTEALRRLHRPGRALDNGARLPSGKIAGVGEQFEAALRREAGTEHHIAAGVEGEIALAFEKRGRQAPRGEVLIQQMSEFDHGHG